MTRKRIKLPSVGGFNAGRGSIMALRPQPHVGNSSQIEYQLLTRWEATNNRTRAESRRLIRQNILLAVKYKGRWWITLNPDCEDQLNDL